MRAEVNFNAASACARAAEVNASNIVSLRIRSFNERLSEGSRPAKCDNTFDTGHIEHSFGCGGRNSKMPFIKRETKGRLPSCLPSIGSCNCEIHALQTAIVIVIKWGFWDGRSGRSTLLRP